jgi:hypothetical protein
MAVSKSEQLPEDGQVRLKHGAVLIVILMLY